MLRVKEVHTDISQTPDSTDISRQLTFKYLRNPEFEIPLGINNTSAYVNDGHIDS